MSINTQKIKQLILNHLNLVNLKPKIFLIERKQEEVEKKEKEFEEEYKKNKNERKKRKAKDDDHSGLDEV